MESTQPSETASAAQINTSENIFKTDTPKAGLVKHKATHSWLPVCVSPETTEPLSSSISQSKSTNTNVSQANSSVPRSNSSLSRPISINTSISLPNSSVSQPSPSVLQPSSSVSQSSPSISQSGGIGVKQDPVEVRTRPQITINFRWKQSNKIRSKTIFSSIGAKARKECRAPASVISKKTPLTQNIQTGGSVARISQVVERPDFSIDSISLAEASSPFRFNRQQWLRHFTKPLRDQTRMSAPPSDWHMRSYFRLLREDGLERIQRKNALRKIANADFSGAATKSHTRTAGTVDSCAPSSVVSKANTKKLAGNDRVDFETNSFTVTESTVHRTATMPMMSSAGTEVIEEDNVYDLLEAQYLQQHINALALVQDDHEQQAGDCESTNSGHNFSPSDKSLSAGLVGSVLGGASPFAGVYMPIDSTVSGVGSNLYQVSGTQKQTGAGLSNTHSQTQSTHPAYTTQPATSNAANTILSSSANNMVASNANRVTSGNNPAIVSGAMNPIPLNTDKARAVSNATPTGKTTDGIVYAQAKVVQPGANTLTATSGVTPTTTPPQAFSPAQTNPHTLPHNGQSNSMPSSAPTSASIASSKQPERESCSVNSYGTVNKNGGGSDSSTADTANRAGPAMKSACVPGPRAAVGSAGGAALEGGVTINGVSAEKFKFTTPGPGLYDAIGNVKEVQTSCVINLYYSGYSLGEKADGVVFPYDRGSHELLDAIDNRTLPLELVSLIDVLPGVKRVNGGIFVEVRDHREPSALDLPAPTVSRVFLRPTPLHVVSYAHEIALKAAQKEWGERELLQIEAKVIAATSTQALCLDPSPFVHYVNISSHYNRHKLHAVLHNRKCKSAKQKASARQSAEVHWDFAANLFDQGMEITEMSLSDGEDVSGSEVGLVEKPFKRSASIPVQSAMSKRYKSEAVTTRIVTTRIVVSTEDKAVSANQVQNSWTERISGRSQSQFAVLNFLGRLRGSTDANMSPLHSSLDVTVCNRSRVRDPYALNAVGAASAAKTPVTSRVAVKLPTTRPEIPTRLSTGAIHCRTVVFQGKAGSTGLDIVLNRNSVYEGILRIVKLPRSAEPTMKQFVLGDYSCADHYVMDFKKLYKLEGNVCTKDETFYPPRTIISKTPVPADTQFSSSETSDVGSKPLQGSAALPSTNLPAYTTNNIPKPTQSHNAYQNSQKLGGMAMSGSKSQAHKNYVQSNMQLNTAPLTQHQNQQRVSAVQQNPTYNTVTTTTTSSPAAYPQHSNTARAATKPHTKPNQRQMQQQFKIERRTSSTGSVAMSTPSVATTTVNATTSHQTTSGVGGAVPAINKFTGASMGTAGGTRPLLASAVYQPTTTTAIPQQTYAPSTVQPQTEGAASSYNTGYAPTPTSNTYASTRNNSYIPNSNGLQTNYPATKYANPTYENKSATSSSKQFTSKYAASGGKQYAANTTNNASVNHAATINTPKQTGGQVLPMNANSMSTKTSKQSVNNTRQSLNGTRPTVVSSTQATNVSQQLVGKRTSFQANYQTHYSTPVTTTPGAALNSASSGSMLNRVTTSYSNGFQSTSGNGAGVNGSVGSSVVPNTPGTASSTTTDARRASVSVSRRSSASSTASPTATSYLSKQSGASVYQQHANQRVNQPASQQAKQTNTQSTDTVSTAVMTPNNGYGIAGSARYSDKNIGALSNTGIGVSQVPVTGAQLSQQSTNHEVTSSVQQLSRPQVQSAQHTRIPSGKNAHAISSHSANLPPTNTASMSAATLYTQSGPPQQPHATYNTSIASSTTSNVQPTNVPKTKFVAHSMHATYTSSNNSTTTTSTSPDIQTLGTNNTNANANLPQTDTRAIGCETAAATVGYNYGTATSTSGTVGAVQPMVARDMKSATLTTSPALGGDGAGVRASVADASPGNRNTPGANTWAAQMSTAHSNGLMHTKLSSPQISHSGTQQISQVNNDQTQQSSRLNSTQYSAQHQRQILTQSASQSQLPAGQSRPLAGQSQPSATQAQWSADTSQPSVGGAQLSTGQSQPMPGHSQSSSQLQLAATSSLAPTDQSKLPTTQLSSSSNQPQLSSELPQASASDSPHISCQSMPSTTHIQPIASDSHLRTSQSNTEQAPVVEAKSTNPPPVSRSSSVNLDSAPLLAKPPQQGHPNQPPDKAQESQVQQLPEQSQLQLEGASPTLTIHPQQGDGTPISQQQMASTSSALGVCAQQSGCEPHSESSSTLVAHKGYVGPIKMSQQTPLQQYAQHQLSTQPSQLLPKSQSTSTLQPTESPPSSQPSPLPRTYHTRQKNANQAQVSQMQTRQDKV
ncbi:hypothetical protein SARC_01393 [Sphaeroforma arctica JP610]|uniref:Spt20-like SEP domain-containing protein n=1 Tax=Sphaeroforma arctica JP610 TaxID=667725 RepID=A0A0L0GBP5_9EUKA|nr:hypothetical protein SARC_01393 [Sphaeroforma arctica JP610]KNC86437.1 hypothetical protein SARC_01393 [Sphaeroforma arctica JP610]|eukprot:XP_014160339.1 hypothetical protein SARC_01393 [Sphaeroforma arctica JP610]